MKVLLVLGFIAAASAIPPGYLRPALVPDFSLLIKPYSEIREQLNAEQARALEEMLSALDDDSKVNFVQVSEDINPEVLINALNFIQDILGISEEDEENDQSEQSSVGESASVASASVDESASVVPASVGESASVASASVGENANVEANLSNIVPVEVSSDEEKELAGESVADEEIVSEV